MLDCTPWTESSLEEKKTVNHPFKYKYKVYADESDTGNNSGVAGSALTWSETLAQTQQERHLNFISDGTWMGIDQIHVDCTDCFALLPFFNMF